MSIRSQILDATASLARIQGLDMVTMSAVCTTAGVARGSLYSNFESVDAIVAELWLEFGADWLTEVLAFDPEVGASPYTAVFVDALLSGPRRPEIAEVVQPQLQRLLDEATARGVWARDEWVWRTSLALGVVIAETVGINAGRDSSLFFWHLLATYASTAPHLAPNEPTPTPSSLDVLPEGDDTPSRLLRGGATVVASSGVANASILRVCRVARLSAGAVPHHFESLDELLLASFAAVLRNVVEGNEEDYFSVAFQEQPALETGRGIIDSLRPVRRVWRQLRREMLVAARCNPLMRRALDDSLSVSEEQLGRAMVHRGMPTDLTQQLLIANRVFTIALSLLFDYGLAVDQTRFTAVSTWSLDQLLGSSA